MQRYPRSEFHFWPALWRRVKRFICCTGSEIDYTELCLYTKPKRKWFHLPRFIERKRSAVRTKNHKWRSAVIWGRRDNHRKLKNTTIIDVEYSRRSDLLFAIIDVPSLEDIHEERSGFIPNYDDGDIFHYYGSLMEYSKEARQTENEETIL